MKAIFLKIFGFIKTQKWYCKKFHKKYYETTMWFYSNVVKKCSKCGEEFEEKSPHALDFHILGMALKNNHI